MIDLSFNYITFQTVDPGICSILIFLVKKSKESRTIFCPIFWVLFFWRKIFLILCSINWSNLIIYLLLLLEIMDNMCNVIICFSVCEVLNFENNLTLKIYKSYQRKEFSTWRKVLFIIFKRTFIETDKKKFFFEAESSNLNEPWQKYFLTITFV